MTTATRKRAKALTRQDWVRAARRALIKSGIEGVKIEPLARVLAVTPGSFYWHFQKREDLHAALLADWRDSNTASFHRAVERAGSDPRDQYLAVLGVWVLEKEFDPRYDRAVREWAQRSTKVRAILREVDKDRIDLLTTIFEGFGYHGLVAEMRARVAYYHQAGYYALDIVEPQSRRIELGPYYAEILTGLPFLYGIGPDRIEAALRGDYRFGEPAAAGASPGD